MAATQNGTGSLTIGGQATEAAVYVNVPVGTIIESVTTNPGGNPIFEDVMDEDGAFHTRITFEKRMTRATIVAVGSVLQNDDDPATDIAAGDMMNTNYYVESSQIERTKSSVRHTVTVVKLTGL